MNFGDATQHAHSCLCHESLSEAQLATSECSPRLSGLENAWALIRLCQKHMLAFRIARFKLMLLLLSGKRLHIKIG